MSSVRNRSGPNKFLIGLLFTSRLLSHAAEQANPGELVEYCDLAAGAGFETSQSSDMPASHQA
jgi:hypothetical protein